jgi:hypothetical protein
MKNPILLICLILFYYAASAQKVAALPDKYKILIGEQIQLQVFGDFPKGQNITWFTADTIDHFEIMQKSEVDTIDNDAAGTITVKQTLVITSWDSGKWEFPSLVMGSAVTAPFTVEVGYSPMDPDQPYHDIKDILAVQKPKDSKWYWYFIFVVVLIALFMLFFPPEKKKIIDKTIFVPDIGAYQKAMLELEQLESSALADDKVYYTKLIQIFREYLHKRKNIQSFSKTTDDLGLQMKKLELDPAQYTYLLQVLRMSDLVKYAKFRSIPEDQKDAVKTIRNTIMSIENPNAV